MLESKISKEQRRAYNQSVTRSAIETAKKAGASGGMGYAFLLLAGYEIFLETGGWIAIPALALAMFSFIRSSVLMGQINNFE